uniref:MFS domain-containing protein n=1 Tax=Panagrellus redivivus TaxID=6233 RepID=A0A7E4VZJ1_PANRE
MTLVVKPDGNLNKTSNETISVATITSLMSSYSYMTSSAISLTFRKSKTDWTSIYVATCVCFIGSVQYSLYFASMWPYLQTIDPTATENFCGLIIAIYNLAQMFASPIIGTWSNKIQSSVPPLYVSLTLMIVGNFIYFFAPILPFPFTKKWVLLIARAISGFGSANVSLLKAYACAASTSGDRSKAIAYVTGGVSIGLSMGPAFQLLFTPLGASRISLGNHVKINTFTAPALVGNVMLVFAMILVKKYFIEKHIGVPRQRDMEKYDKLPPYDRVASSVCYFTRFCQMFVMTNLESIGTPLAMTMFAWNRATVVRNVAIAQALQAFCTLTTHVIYIKFDIGKKINSKQTLYFAAGGLIVFYMATYPWPFSGGQLVVFNNNDVYAANGTELAGCNTDYFSWCHDLSPINVWVFYGSFVLILGICYSTFNISLNTLFSKIIGPRPQAAQQGWLQVSGGAAKFVGPIIISSLYTDHGPRWPWNVELILMGFTLVMWLILRHRMVPLRIPESFATYQDPHDPDL